MTEDSSDLDALDDCAETSESVSHFSRNMLRIRLDRDLGQEEMAERIRKAGQELGEPNNCTKRLVQKWESGEHSTIRPNYRRALLRATGVSYAQLCEPWQEHPPLSNNTQTVLVLLDSVMTQLAALRVQLEPRSQGGRL